jgi:hypothetical protein
MYRQKTKDSNRRECLKMKKLMGLKLDMVEMERVAGGAVGPVCNKPHNETGPLGTGSIGYPPLKTGPLGTGPLGTGPLKETGPLMPDSCDPPFKTGPLGNGPLKETGPIGYPY